MKKFLIFSFFVLLAIGGFSARQYWVTYDTPAYVQKWGWFPTTTFIPLYERKVETAQVLKVGVITDTHVHPNRIDRSNKDEYAPRHLGSYKDAHPLELFNAQMAQFKPDMIVHMGDVIEGTNDTDVVGMMGLDLVQTELEKSGVPVHWVVGNHDLRSVTKQQFQDTLEIDYLNKSFDYSDYRIIILDANYYPDGRDVEPSGKRHIPGYVHPDTLAWFETQLDTDKHVYVIMHQAAFDQKVAQGESADMLAVSARAQEALSHAQTSDARDVLRKKIAAFKKYRTKKKASITNARELRDVMEKYHVEAFFNGHLEVARYEENSGVRYYSLTGTKKSGLFPESFYELTITDGMPELIMHYTDPVSQEPRVVDFKKEMAQ